ncbi:sigma 54-interacting transcriptional regulator [Pelotomaculum terephthalicicum JT]|uniref:sigma-54 interaction domain-containing protein n=1 Tax=Pelotomaculum TaxID=191373 RepID=UPI0009C591C8|nr:MULTISPECIES: sigma 54-interacting transcriptional regulator [Pelotomaculum]MCG9968909.1 sigma 54-interacting transcriptional regulator [Pelotomaculum terephthalicicum JT]OPX85805.1 MAG: Formate hydrogenlyase transcriptional activator [Pelotomaculum sp. PtaB.Bin117]OPY63956.1 MAG: Formate hydrogenlyase transcriptional activator [Pelotomaculum sp. PtaU1.Bin065]
MFNSLVESIGILGHAVLDSSPEGILLADHEGNIVYANNSYTLICRNDGQKRIGQNILKTNPYGALTEVILTGQPVFGKKHLPPGAQTEVLSNAFPIHIDNQFVGAIVFFRGVTEAMSMLDKLAKAREDIRSSSDRSKQIGQARYDFNTIAGQTQCFKEAITIAQRVSQTDSTVLLRGESGTGKQLFAEAIHNNSMRRYQPFVNVNCAAIPDSLLESEFFGYEKGSFTGAGQQKIGTFEVANQGTIFLDEIGDMDLRLQAKLLQVLQNGKFRRLGGTKEIKVNTRVIAATNRNLEELIAKDLFRLDLYYRLNVVNIEIPPLRKRIDDIPLIVQNLLPKISCRVGRAIKGLEDKALGKLANHCWPGNIRELENVLEKAGTLCDREWIKADDICLSPLPSQKPESIVSLEELERSMISRALAKYGPSLAGKKEAAQALGISLTTLYNKLRKFKCD